MTEERITEWRFDAECDELAQEIFDEMLSDMADDETPDNHMNDMMDRAHETADGHQWVIYHFYAHQVCAACNTDMGEQFLEDVGTPESPTYDSLGSMIAYGEMRGRIEAKLQELADEWEPAEEEEEEETA